MLQYHLTKCLKGDYITAMSYLPNKKHYEEKQDYNQSKVEFENESFHDRAKC